MIIRWHGCSAGRVAGLSGCGTLTVSTRGGDTVDRDEARDKAGEKFGEFRDKTGEVLEELRTKGQEFIGKHEDKIDSAIDKVAGFVDDQTKGRYHEKIETVAGKAKVTVERLAGEDSAAAATATAETVAATDTTESAVPTDAGETFAAGGTVEPGGTSESAAVGGAPVAAEPAPPVPPSGVDAAPPTGGESPSGAEETPSNPQNSAHRG